MVKCNLGRLHGNSKNKNKTSSSWGSGGKEQQYHGCSHVSATATLPSVLLFLLLDLNAISTRHCCLQRPKNLRRPFPDLLSSPIHNLWHTGGPKFDFLPLKSAKEDSNSLNAPLKEPPSAPLQLPLKVPLDAPLAALVCACAPLSVHYHLHPWKPPPPLIAHSHNEVLCRLLRGTLGDLVPPPPSLNTACEIIERETFSVTITLQNQGGAFKTKWLAT